MKAFLPLSTEEQLANHLRGEIMRGGLSGMMPGVLQLASSLGTSPKTVFAAIRRLEHEGLLRKQGPGRSSLIVLPHDQKPPVMRVEILIYDRFGPTKDYMVDLKHRLEHAGHVVNFSSKTLLELGMDTRRVARFVQETQADAWVVVAGSHPVLEWFAAQPFPVFTLFRFTDLPTAGFRPKKESALATALRRLVAMGHRRIVLLVREDHRKPQPGFFERRFLELLESEGIATGSYNIPDWEDDVPGLHRCLDSLFQHTPPTAMFIDEGALFIATRLHLAKRGYLVPRDVSLIALDTDQTFNWCSPPISHIHWDTSAVTRRILRWVANVASGKDDRQKTTGKVEFFEGGTIGPAKA